MNLIPRIKSTNRFNAPTSAELLHTLSITSSARLAFSLKLSSCLKPMIHRLEDHFVQVVSYIVERTLNADCGMIDCHEWMKIIWWFVWHGVWRVVNRKHVSNDVNFQFCLYVQVLVDDLINFGLIDEVQTPNAHGLCFLIGNHTLQE